MQVEFTTTEGDYLQFMKDSQRGALTSAARGNGLSPIVKGSFIYLLVLTAAVAFFFTVIKAPEGRAPRPTTDLTLLWVVGWIVLVAVVVGGVSYVSLRRRTQGAARSISGSLGVCWFGIEPDALYMRTKACDGRLFWHGVQDVVERPDHVYVMCSTVGGIVFPKRAFASPEQVAEFVRLCREYQQAAVVTPTV